MSMDSTASHGERQDVDGNTRKLLRQLPSISTILSDPSTEELEIEYGRELLVEALRTVVDKSRQRILEGRSAVPSEQALLVECRQWLVDYLAPTLYPVINATGVIIHTNLGRAPLDEKTVRSVSEIATSYSNLEYDIQLGARGSRTVHAEEMLMRITGAEAALVVNNNAAAVLLMLTALCNERDVIISRSQLIEIGGGFRIPDVMLQSGARLVEVGTTNRTHIRDYADAINERTAALFVAHHSNFKILGFTTEPALTEIADLAGEHGVLSLFDQGSGAIIDTERYGIDNEPTVGYGLDSGMDVVTFSGDKLLGGPQAGILCGKRSIIERIKKHPLARAVRTDKMALAALTGTLRHYLSGKYEDHIPVWQMISQSVKQLEERAHDWQSVLADSGIDSELIKGESTIGGGSLPGSTLPTVLLAVSNDKAEQLSLLLRNANPPVIARIADDRLLFDPRTVLPSKDTHLLEVLINCANETNLH